MKSVLIQLSGQDLETLIFDCVDRAIKFNYSTNPTNSDAEPFGTFGWLQGVCAGIPASTLRIKSAAGEIPGVKKFGKRVLYDKAEVVNWLRSQSKPAKPDAAELEQVAEQQVNVRLEKRRDATQAKRTTRPTTARP
ncbi:hypothetical protein J2I47_16750 [Fibrella sp. HMF5335]|uniref:Helix-turn-helix domain-containing protein n=1 Tax=Fibrella rubiginis TaxID=2817060 RepID=A0A939GJ55_9BACT|nr:hypothetical protein [Fibrella rubiginis]MBO0938204.1 hypothetical protein [Fibrella rubiginis]